MPKVQERNGYPYVNIPAELVDVMQIKAGDQILFSKIDADNIKIEIIRKTRRGLADTKINLSQK